jgi:hypothetical protein
MTVLLDYMLEVVIKSICGLWIGCLILWQECDADVVIANDSDLWPYLGVILISSLL